MMKQLKEFVRVGAVLVCSVQPCLAQTAEELAGARAAAEQGVKAYAEGRWAATVDLMTRAEKLVHAPTHLLYLAQAEEKLGHLVIAHETYVKLARERLAPDAPEVFVAAQNEAKTRAEVLRSRLSQVSVVVQGDAAGSSVTVTMDGRRVPEALVGVPHPVDPGDHEFQAAAEGMRSGRSKISLSEGGSETVVLTLRPTGEPTRPPQKSKVNGVSGLSAAAGPPQGALGSPSPDQASSSGFNALRVGGYIGLGVGAAGLAVGTVFLLKSKAARSDANALCSGPDGCRQTDRSRIEELDSNAESWERLGIGGLVAGGVGIVAGVSMLLLAPSSPQGTAQAKRLLPYFTGNQAGVLGRF